MNDNLRSIRMYSVHEIVIQSEDIKVSEDDGQWGIGFHLFLPGTSSGKMRVSNLFVFIFALCIVVECSGTVLTRVTRTLPFDLSPARWTSMFRNLWSGGRLWEWPRNSAEYLLRLVAGPDTRKKMVFEFRPEDGPRASYAYQNRYGYRGQWLIELLGSGFHPDSVPYRQPLPPSVLVPPAPPL